jgi:hypothetical protein
MPKQEWLPLGSQHVSQIEVNQTTADDRCERSLCLEEPTIGLHGVTEGKAFSFSLCERHYNQLKTRGEEE